MFGKNIKFDSAVKMLEYIQDGHDLYSPKENVYVFVYNEEGSICYYDDISNEKAMELYNDAKEDHEYWGAFLGVGGHICDSADYYIYEHEDGLKALIEAINYGNTDIQWCEDMYHVSDWEDVTVDSKEK